MSLDGADPKSPDRTDLARALGELEAAKARVERDAKALHAETRKQLVGELLPVLDNVDRAIAAGEPNAVTGMQLVRRQLEGVLRGYGVERIDTTGRAFDPQLHDAIATLPVTDPDQHRRVIDQIEPGYRFGDALLRPAKVVVGAYAKPAIPEPVREQRDVFEPEPAAVSVDPQPARLPALDPRYFRQPERVVRPLREPFSPFRSPHHRGRR
jgi:molecular chaperone GrpE (heat shock protein)